jgi:hypothetical protein
MFQRASRSRDAGHAVAAIRPAPQPDHHVANAIGKASLVPQVTPHFAPADAYTHGIETAQRDVRAVRVAALPALIKALRSKAPTLEKQIEFTKAANQVRHLLMSANKHVVLLEKTATFRDPMLKFLRREIDALVARAFRLGAYKGFEHLRPRGYDEPLKQPPPIRRAPGLPPREPLGRPMPRDLASALRNPRRRIARGTRATSLRIQPRQGAPK